MTMRTTFGLWFGGSLATGTLCATLFATAAFASPCGQEADQLEPRLNSIGHAAVAANSGGQAVAGERGAATQKPEQGRSVQPEANSAASQARDQVGGVGEKFQEAKVALNDARTADKKGDAKGCEDALARVRSLIGK